MGVLVAAPIISHSPTSLPSHKKAMNGARHPLDSGPHHITPHHSSDEKSPHKMAGLAAMGAKVKCSQTHIYICMGPRSNKRALVKCAPTYQCVEK